MTWTPQVSGTGKRLSAVAYGNGIFVAIGGDRDESVILTSADGLHWTPNERNRGCPMGAITFGNGNFLVTGAAGYGLAMMSPDGKSWRDVLHPTSATVTLAFGQGRFIAVDAWEQPVSSADGANWVPAFADRKYGRHFVGAAFGNGKYVAVGMGDLAVSGDGINWQDIDPPPAKLLRGKLVERGPFFFPFFQSKQGNILGYPPFHPVSKDGQTWRISTRVPVSGNVSDGETLFMRPNSDYENVVLYSEDGINWHRLSPINSQPPVPAVAASAVSNPPVAATTDVSRVGITFQLNGRLYRLNLTAQVGQVYQLQASTDLDHWETLTTLTNAGTEFGFIDQDAGKYPQRFYRLKPQP
jgi:hypothetical protein